MQPIHRRRLREIWRSAGWPCHDMVEVELLAAGLLERVRHASGHETLRVTDAGVALIAETLQRNRAARDAHEELVERVARAMTRNGRIAWRGLSLRAKVGDGWAVAMPDVYSVRNTSVEMHTARYMTSRAIALTAASAVKEPDSARISATPAPNRIAFAGVR